MVADSLPSLRGVPLWRFHTTALRERRHDLARTLIDAAADGGPLRPRLHEIARAVAFACLGPPPWVMQARPYVRVHPPRKKDAVTPFHVDAWALHPRQQVTIWIPLVEVLGPEGLWLADDDVARPWFDGSRALQEAQAPLRSVARSVAMVVGELLVFGPWTAHGGVLHDNDRTRVSLDVRVAPAGHGPAPGMGWAGRPLDDGPRATLCPVGRSQHR